MYRLRRYFPPDTRPGAKPAGPPVLMVHPMMMSADMWDVTRHDGAVGILHQAGIDPWVIDFGSPDQVEGGMQRQPGRPRRRAERGHRHRQDGHRPRRPPGRVLAGRHVRLPDRGVPTVQGPGEHHRFRCARRHPGRAADEPARRPGCRRSGLHGRPRLQPHRHPRLARAHGLSDARPDQDRAIATGLLAPAARPRSAVVARAAAAIPVQRRLDRLVGSGDRRAAQAVHRPQPDDERRLFIHGDLVTLSRTSTAPCSRSSARSTTSANPPRCVASSGRHRRRTSTNT